MLWFKRLGYLAAVLAVVMVGCATEEATADKPTLDATDASAAETFESDSVAADSGELEPSEPPTIPYGDPDQNGPWPVGVATISVADPAGGSDVPVEVWYPAAEVNAPTVYAFRGVEIAANVSRGVPAAKDAPRLVVGFSHGFGGVRWQNFSMAERLASYGFVVVAPDHPGTTLMDMLDTFGQAATTLLHRPQLLMDSVDAVRAGAVQGLQTRGEKLALVGHSMGSLTILPLGGGVISSQRYNDACTKGGHGGCDIVGPMADTMPALSTAFVQADPRVAAMVAQNTAGTFAFEPDSLQALPNTLVMTGTKDSGFYEDGALLAYQLAGKGTAFVAYTGGGHNGPTDICNIPAASLVGADCAYEKNGFAEPNGVRKLANRHTLAWLASRFGNQPKFAQHLGPGDGYAWEQK